MSTPPPVSPPPASRDDVDRNPHSERMASASMVRNLAAQAQAIWPQEREYLRRYRPPSGARATDTMTDTMDVMHIVDVGCGTGEITARLAELFPDARIRGIDITESHIELARERYQHLQDRVEFAVGDGFHLDMADDVSDLTVNRHVLQAVANPEAMLAELMRITRPGGWLHLIVEDYGLVHFSHEEKDIDEFFHRGVFPHARSLHTNLQLGRQFYRHLRALALQNIAIDYLIIDTLRVDRALFATIIEAWRDTFAQSIAETSPFTAEESYEYFNAMIECVRDPDGYAVWHIPLMSAQVPQIRK